jgi:HAD superfamily hydrolase (TIGR01509 family)
MPTADSKGVLFDVDGTLVDTTYVHTVCWSESLRNHGRFVPMADVHHAIGMGSTDLLDLVLGQDRDRSADEDIIDGHMKLYQQYWQRLVPLPGAADLLRACTARGLQVVLASSASDQELEALRTALDADDAISTATSGSDADAAKPAPDVLQAALDNAGLRADQAVFVGDAVWDGIAAERAGIEFIAVTCGGTPADELRASGAREVYRDPAELCDAFGSSVLGRLQHS